MNDEQVENALWQELTIRGVVHGDYAAISPRTPWPIRLVIGGAGWLGALFFQIFLWGTLLFGIYQNGSAMMFVGAGMIAIAVWLYRGITTERKAIGIGIALNQFALLFSLGGQGLIMFGVSKVFGGFDRLFDTVYFWLGLVLLEGVLVALVPDRLFRFLAALIAWLALSVAIHIAALGHLKALRWMEITVVLSLLVFGGLIVLLIFVLNEARLAATGRHRVWEPIADATLFFVIVSALIVTGLTHSAGRVFDFPPWVAPDGWVVGALIGAALFVFIWIECQRLACAQWVRATILMAVIVFSALMAYAPAFSAGVLALAIALRRGSLPWLGLAIASILIGFIYYYYYSMLQWTLLVKSATLVAAGMLLFAARASLIYLSRKEAIV